VAAAFSWVGKLTLPGIIAFCAVVCLLCGLLMLALIRGSRD
jgi:hypothetical protein